MTKYLNRKKFIIFNKKIFFRLFLFLIIFFLIFAFYFKNRDIKNFIYNSINFFSKEFDYIYTKTEVLGIDKIKITNIENILNKYKNKSIFLIPLKKISYDLKELGWIKNLKISKQFKDTLLLEIVEHKPLAILHFNNQYFYFDQTGNIIDLANGIKNIDNLLIFSGQSSNLNANLILKLLNKSNIDFQNKIYKIEYVEKRRWNIILKNKIILMLSENYPEDSINNFLKIKKNLSEEDLSKIKKIDLRNINKTTIMYKND